MLLICPRARTPKRPALFQATLFLPTLALVLAQPAPAQQGSSSPAPEPATPQSSDAAPKKQDQPAKPDPSQEQKPGDAKPLTPEEARQAQILADTNRLYQLAQELQAEVAKSNKNTLSLAVVKKAAEVEKLAKSLKERMKPE
ncbi:MAG: hypothetical protein JOZ33_11120 [Acidobacteriaceae bacterium]|nr:hypothetical protein [Acidobacteriaceae bacterium]